MPLAGHDTFHFFLLSSNHSISTPMPLAGHDYRCIEMVTKLENFYSHAPRGA